MTQCLGENHVKNHKKSLTPLRRRGFIIKKSGLVTNALLTKRAYIYSLKNFIAFLKKINSLKNKAIPKISVKKIL